MVGSIHDYTLLKQEFDPKKSWFKDFQVWIDLGYLGFAKDYPCKNLKIPYKKPYKTKNNPEPQLTSKQKEHNKNVSKTRVKVENAIAGIKRYNILNHVFRNKSLKLLDKSIFLAAGIWNWTQGFSFH